MARYTVYRGRRRANFSSLSMTMELIIINVVAFVLFWALDKFGVLPLQYVAISANGIFQYHFLWTFITSMFMHGGIFHLFVNMLSLYFVGSLVERIIGTRRYLLFYLLAGVFSGLVFIITPLITGTGWGEMAVGASGALFGLIGLLIFLTPNLPVYVMFVPIPIKMKYAAPGMLILLWLISASAGIPIGNMAHLGGLLFGMAYGFYLKKKYPNKVKMIWRHFS